MTSPRTYRAGEEVVDRELSLYRRIPPDKPDYYSERKGRPTSLNLLPDSDEEYVSMHLGDRTSPETVLANHPRAGLFEIKVGALLDAGLKVTYQPEEGPDHVGVWGLKNGTDGQRRALIKQIVKSWPPRAAADTR